MIFPMEAEGNTNRAGEVLRGFLNLVFGSRRRSVRVQHWDASSQLAEIDRVAALATQEGPSRFSSRSGGEARRVKVPYYVRATGKTVQVPATVWDMSESYARIRAMVAEATRGIDDDNDDVPTIGVLQKRAGILDHRDPRSST